MMRDWENRPGVARGLLLKICRRWLEKCDGLLYLGPSAGAEAELRIAQKLKLRIFQSVNEIPVLQTLRKQ